MDFLQTLRMGRLHLAHQLFPKSVFRRSRLVLRMFSYESTMGRSGRKDLRELLDMIPRLPGEIVECGSHYCGTTMIMANYLRSQGVEKIIYACDSFGGFPADEFERERQLGRTNKPQATYTEAGQYEHVNEKILRMGMDKQVQVVKGLFQDSFPRWVSEWETRKLCFVLVDCDLEESMLFCAHALWPLLVPGGVMAFDDYTSEEYQGARIAVDKFVAERPTDLGEHKLMRKLYLLRKKS
jgi:hypothetical protein